MGMAAPAQSETQTSTKTAAVVFNPIKVDEAKLRAAVAAAESSAGWGTSLFYETSEEDPGGGQAKVALALNELSSTSSSGA